MDWPELFEKKWKRAFQIQNQKGRGRCVVAARDIRAGEIIISEEASIVGPIWSKPSKNICVGCFFPFQMSGAKHKCSQCRLPLCEVQCERSKNHEIECKHLSTISSPIEEDFQDFHLITPLRFILLRQSSPDTFGELMQLEANVDDKKASNGWTKIAECAVTLFHKYSANNLATLPEIEQILCILDCNSFQVLSRATFESMGAVFRQSSMLNHACKPNARPVATGSYGMRVVACEDIAMGREITVSYLQPFLTTLQRRRLLRLGKCFECDCQRCSDPTEFGSFASAFLCKSCSNGSVISTNSLDEEAPWQCQSCHMFMDSGTAKQLDLLLESELKKVNSDSKDNVKKFFRTYEVYLHENHAFLSQLNLWICEEQNVEENTSKFWREKKELCQKLLQILDLIEPKYSYLKGIISLQLCESLLREGETPAPEVEEEAKENLNFARKVFQHEDPTGPEKAILEKIGQIQKLFTKPKS